MSKPSTYIDPALLALIAKGDRRAFGQLYDLSSPILFALLQRVLGDRKEAEEMLQDIYAGGLGQEPPLR